MIFSLKQDEKINSIIDVLKMENGLIKWVLKEEDKKYMNTIDECLTICIGHGELTHLSDMNYDTELETYHYYSNKRQLDYFINIFRHNKTDIRYVVYKCNNGEIGGSHKLTSGILEY